MTDISADLTTHISVRHPRLPRLAPVLTATLAIAAALIIGLSLHFNIAGIVVIAALLHLIALPIWSLAVENRRSAVDRLMTGLVWSALAIALIPLASLLWMVVKNGAGQLSSTFFTSSMRNVIGQGGGIQHAMVGTLTITLAATVISVPIGVMAAIYMVEYGSLSRAAAVLRFLVDVMTGIPSIVAGLFAYALFALFFGAGVQMGLGGAVALSLLMIPIVVRSTEEMLKLVPEHLREAAYALGVPKWRTIVKVVLPTASSGIITGITLAVARVIGETAPLLIIAGATASTNWDLFAPQTPTETLPVFIYSQYISPGLFPQFSIDRAWGAAFVLIIIVLALNLIARILGRILSPSKSH